MSSGLYSALSAAKSRLAMMDTITENLANVNTAGFKKGQSVFAAVLDGQSATTAAKGINFTKIRGQFSDFSQGTLTQTGMPLDLGINGEGFFKVRDAGGNLYYTRQGNMHRDAQFNLRALNGMQVLGAGDKPINLPGTDFAVDVEGNVALDNGSVENIPIYTFDDKATLERRGGGLFVAGEDSPAKPVERPQILQGHLEAANVQSMEEVVLMMESLRIFEAGQKAIKTYDTLASKADELGSVG